MNKLLLVKLRELKGAIRDWIGTLTVREIMTNKELTDTFEKIEMIIQKIEEGNVQQTY